MWERAMAEASEVDIQERTLKLDQLSRIMAQAADEMGLTGQNCRRICVDRLEMVEGQMQRVVVCKIVCT